MRCSILQIKCKNFDNRYWVSSSLTDSGYIFVHSDGIPSLISPSEYMNVAMWCHDYNFEIINQKEFVGAWPTNDDLNLLRKEWFS